jgi:hypothetical protein
MVLEGDVRGGEAGEDGSRLHRLDVEAEELACRWSVDDECVVDREGVLRVA